MEHSPNIGRAMKWAAFVDDLVLREWLLNIGQRHALQRLAHLFCELCVRLTVVKLVEDPETFVMPLTQAELADTTGITEVHLNRLLTRLRKDGLISLKGRKLTILKFDRLAELAGFDEAYLHTDGPR